MKKKCVFCKGKLDKYSIEIIDGVGGVIEYIDGYKNICSKCIRKLLNILDNEGT